MRRSSVLAAAFVVASLAAAPFASSARAEDPPAGAAGKPADKADGKGDGKSDAKGDKAGKADAAQPTRLERAKRLVQELETTIALLKATRSADAETMKALEKALEDARALAKPVTMAELTEEEKRALAEEFKKAADAAKDGKDGGEPKDPAGPTAGGFGEEWRKQSIERAFKDADLTEDEQIEAGKIISDWFDKSWAAQRAGETKRASELKRERDEKLEKQIGRKKAQKVINNLNAMTPGRR